MTIAWTPRSSPFDDGGYGWRVRWFPDLAKFFATGYIAAGDPFVVVVSENGSDWVGKGSRSGTLVESLKPTGGGDASFYQESKPGQAYQLSDIAYSPSLNRLVAVHSEEQPDGMYTSDDGGETWTPQNNPLNNGDYTYYSYLTGVAWSADLNLFVACGIVGVSPGGGFGANCYTAAYSSDGLSWTALVNVNSAWANIGDGALTVSWIQEINKFVLGGNDDGGITLSSDGSSWSPNSGSDPFNDSTEKLASIFYNTEDNSLQATAIEHNGFDGFPKLLMKSTDGGDNWTAIASMYEQYDAYVYSIGKAFDKFLLVGTTHDGITTVAESPDGVTDFETDDTPFNGDGSGFGAGVAYSPELGVAVVVGTSPGEAGPCIISSGTIVTLHLSLRFRSFQNFDDNESD